MPEGHTIHRLARDQNATLARQRLRVTSPQGRFTDGAKRLDGLTLRRVEAAGKHLFYHFAAHRRAGRGRAGIRSARTRGVGTRSAGPILHVHLGLFGKYRSSPNPPPPPRGAVRVRFQSNDHAVDLNGPNQCELLDRAAYRSILARLGPDPLRADADPDRAWSRIKTSRAPIGLLLMDQSVIAGIGNIYRTELLHLAGVHPATPGRDLARRQFTQLWKLAVKLLALGVEHNRIITVDAATLPPDVTKVPRRKLFRIFKHPTCPACACDVERFTFAGRKVFACPTCQPRPDADQNA